MKRPGAIMGYLPPQVKDTLLLVLTVGVLIGVAFQVKQNNTVASQASDTCHSRQKLSAQSQADRQNLLMAFQLFVDVTRRRRSDPTSTSYDPGFVHDIDTQIQPLLNLVDPYRVAAPVTC